MNKTDYQPNSHRSKEEQNQQSAEGQKKVEKVIKGTAKVKKNEMRKFADVFLSEDVKNVKSYVLMDVLVPNIKKVIVDIVSDGVNMIFFGGAKGHGRGSTASKISYSSYYDRRDGDRISSNSRNSRYSYDDIVLDSKGEAEEVLARMDELISMYGMATVADLYDLVGVTGSYTDNKYGWTNIRNAEPIRTRDGYMLKLPKALPIN